MQPEIGPAKSVRAWAGPKQLAKDFQLAGVAFEVKASSTKQHAQFIISGELQLDTKGVKRLILYACFWSDWWRAACRFPNSCNWYARGPAGRSCGCGPFSELLLQVGYTDSDAARYTSRFTVRSQHFFDVRDDFPRIVESDLRAGVGDVHYSIMQSECEHYSLTEG